MSEDKIKQLEEYIFGLKEALLHKQKVIAVMENDLFFLGVQFDYEKAEERWQKLKRASDEMLEVLYPDRAPTLNTHPPQDDESW